MSALIKKITVAAILVAMTVILVSLAIAQSRKNEEELKRNKIVPPPGFEAIETAGGIYYRRLSIDPKLPGASKPAFDSAL